MTKPGETNPARTGEASEAIRLVLDEHKIEILDQPEKLFSALLDHLPRAEVNLLISASRAGIPRQILGARPDTPAEVLLGTLRNRMTIDQGFSRTSAEWVVQAWFGALRPGATVEAAVAGTAPKREGQALEGQKAGQNEGPNPVNRTVNFMIAGAIAVIVIIFGSVYAYRMLTEPPYNFEGLAFFDVTAPETDQWELRNFNSWCKFPGMECAIITPFKVTAPYVQARLEVGYSSQRAAEVPVHCSATNPASEVVVSADAVGSIPDTMYPKLSRTGWMIPFKAPELGWTPGIYKVVCTTSKGTAEASFKVES